MRLAKKEKKKTQRKTGGWGICNAGICPDQVSHCRETSVLSAHKSPINPSHYGLKGNKKNGQMGRTGSPWIFFPTFPNLSRRSRKNHRDITAVSRCFVLQIKLRGLKCRGRRGRDPRYFRVGKNTALWGTKEKGDVGDG